MMTYQDIFTTQISLEINADDLIVTTNLGKALIIDISIKDFES